MIAVSEKYKLIRGNVREMLYLRGGGCFGAQHIRKPVQILPLVQPVIIVPIMETACFLPDHVFASEVQEVLRGGKRVSEIRERARLFFPCPDHELGYAVIAFTERDFGVKIPARKCPECNTSRPLPLFLKFAWIGEPVGLPPTGVVSDSEGVFKKDYMYISDSDLCNECEPPDVIRLHHTSRGLSVRVLFRGMKRQDRKTGEFLSYADVGIRRMTPDGNELRCQPYGDRGHSWGG